MTDSPAEPTPPAAYTPTPRELSTADERERRLRAHPVIAAIIERLRAELPKNLHYHSVGHTEDVLREVILLATLDGRTEREIELLAFAAAFHDSGFMTNLVDNERIAVQMAHNSLSETGQFSDDELALIERMIFDTRLQSTTSGLRQVATSELSNYLLDADLGNLGRDDFFEKGELLRRELGLDRTLFLTRTLDLVVAHSWYTPAARKLRQAKKIENVRRCRIDLEQSSGNAGTGVALGVEHAWFLARLPLLLNSALDTRTVIDRAIDQLRLRVGAEAATVFLLDKDARQLTFWASRGKEKNRLEGLKMPADKGVVGWVITRNESVLITDAANDKRFFGVIDKEGGFKTRDMICTPLNVRGGKPFGAIQVLNRESGGTFTDEQQLFVDQFANHVALAIDNALLLAELRERTRQLQVLEKRKNDMITVIAHEFRTPLNIIQTSADVLSHDLVKSPEDREKMAATLQRGVGRLAKLVNQVKNISLISPEKLEVQRARFDLNALTRDVAAEFEPICRERKLIRSVSCFEGALHADGDEGLLAVALRNLVANAVRFTADGGSVTIQTTKEAGLAKITVTDTGIGIAAGDLALIFEKFFEIGDVLQHSSGDYGFRSAGLGLGLATARGILAAHQSKVEVASEPGKGSTFWFCLPLIE